MNGAKQGGVLSPILFAVSTDGSLAQLKNTGVGCHMDSRFVGTIAYADDITLLAPCKSAFSILISVCELMLQNMILCLMGIKVSCYYLKEDPLLWCLQRLWSMVRWLGTWGV